MDRINLFPTTFFSFKNSDFNNNELIEKLQKYSDRIKTGSIISSLHSLHDKPEFEDLFKWFDSCLDQVRVEEKYDCDNFKITNSWFNVAPANSAMAIHYHRHSMSFFSAVYYLTSGSPTVFEDPVIHRTQAQLEVLRFDYLPTEHILPEPGKLIIFPSWMYHYSIPHMENVDRYIISFNSLPTGRINYQIASDSKAYLNIKEFPND